MLIFHKTCKTSFLVHFWPFRYKNPSIRFFLKNRVPLRFKLYYTLNSYQKSENYRPNGTNGQRVLRSRHNNFYKLFLYVLHNSTSYFHSSILGKLFYCRSCSNMVKFRKKCSKVPCLERQCLLEKWLK